MTRPIFTCPGGTVALPDAALVLVDRADGGNLIVNPPRDVWERSELHPAELTRWSFLVAACGRAMIDVLPQLEDGCINYWEAGNWALNEAAVPVGPKHPREHRRVHLHLLGRSPSASHPSWRWGEAPGFPAFERRHEWAASFTRLTAQECLQIVDRLESILTKRYLMTAGPWQACAGCGYPTPASTLDGRTACAECLEGSGVKGQGMASG